MKVFVSGQISEKHKIKFVYSRLREAGFEITHDWTCTDDLAVCDKFTKEAEIRAAKDIEGVCNADFYVIITDNETCGKGMYVELGAALALSTIGRPIPIYVLGPKNHPSIFYSHPRCINMETLDSCIADMKLRSRETASTELEMA